MLDTLISKSKHWAIRDQLLSLQILILRSVNWLRCFSNLAFSSFSNRIWCFTDVSSLSGTSEWVIKLDFTFGSFGVGVGTIWQSCIRWTLHKQLLLWVAFILFQKYTTVLIRRLSRFYKLLWINCYKNSYVVCSRFLMYNLLFERWWVPFSLLVVDEFGVYIPLMKLI